MDALPGHRAVPEAAVTDVSIFHLDLVAQIPFLRAFSRSLCKRRDIADDVMQETLMKAWRAQTRFAAGTNLRAWLSTILRNEFYTRGRSLQRLTQWDDALDETMTAPEDEQERSMDLCDTVRALHELPRTQKEALILIAVGGFSYKDVAGMCAVKCGTVKSRVSRARAALTDARDTSAKLPRRSASRAATACNDVLAQLSVLTRARALCAGSA